MQLTQTSQVSKFEAPLPEAVLLWFDPDKPNHTQAIMPAGSTFTTGRHWHYDHTECFKVHHGAFLVTIYNKSMVVTSNDGVTEIPVTARHELMRWDRPGLKGHQKAAQDAFKRSRSKEELRELADQNAQLEEFTRPDDGMKELFFRQLMSVTAVEARSGLSFGLSILHVFVIISGFDGGLPFLNLDAENSHGWRGQLEEIVSQLVLGTACLLGNCFGLKIVSDEYSPEHLKVHYHQGKWQ